MFSWFSRNRSEDIYENEKKTAPMGRTADSKGRLLEPADAVRFDCGGFQHWGIYVGEGDIIHMTAQGVTRKHIYDVAKECPYYRDNSFDKVQSPFMKQGIINMAECRIGDKSYNFITNNCEHFVNQVRCGNPNSQQVNDYFKKNRIENFDFVDYGPNGITRTTFFSNKGGHISQTSSFGHAQSSVTGQASAAAVASTPGGTVSSIMTPEGTYSTTCPPMHQIQEKVATAAPPADMKEKLFCSVCHGKNDPKNFKVVIDE